ncbi:unnamed protein product, partial [Mesorhabditis belari]|uniref:Uncharacterized protein n=1 Tax=Mesorhabditis belari TaxID=2138241 RepID=A0AAF3EJ26_9BILA
MPLKLSVLFLAISLCVTAQARFIQSEEPELNTSTVSFENGNESSTGETTTGNIDVQIDVQIDEGSSTDTTHEPTSINVSEPISSSTIVPTSEDPSERRKAAIASVEFEFDYPFVKI